MAEDFPRPLDRLGFQVRQRDDGVDQAHLQRLRGVVLTAEIPDLARFFLPDDAGEVTGAEAAIETADFGAGLAEARVVGGDGEIAHHVQHVPAADGVAGHHRDDGLGQ